MRSYRAKDEPVSIPEPANRNRSLPSSVGTASTAVLGLQRTAGNAAVARLFAIQRAGAGPYKPFRAAVIRQRTISPVQAKKRPPVQKAPLKKAPPIDAPSAAPTMAELTKEDQPYRDPNNANNPVLITRRNDILIISFTGTMRGRSSITLPRQKDIAVVGATFGGEDFLSVNFKDLKRYHPTNVRTVLFSVTKTGVVQEKVHTGLLELVRRMPGETTRQFAEGLKVHTTRAHVRYSRAGGKTVLLFDPGTRVLKVVDAGTSKKVRLTSDSGGFQELFDLSINPDAKGRALLKNVNGKVFTFDINLAVTKRTNWDRSRHALGRL